FLRGFGPSRFLHQKTFRDGRGVALAQDAIHLLDLLAIQRCTVVGHDWGARAAYNLAAIAPHRLRAVIGLGLQYSPNGKFEISGFEQARLWWYQWFMTTDKGAERVRQDPAGFARMQWETWSPAGWFDEEDFSKTADSFFNSDWLAITLHAYRSRWKSEAVDARYDRQQSKIEQTGEIAVPLMTIVGSKDGADVVHEVDDREEYTKHNYELMVLEGIGHFPAREAPEIVAPLVHSFLKRRG
ncbi:MAG: alpha/beta hydrolase, partial [Candidatus Tumulicola sp.]